MRREKKERNLIIAILCGGILMMSVGFAALSSTLNINGSATVKANNWDVHFTNVANEATTGAPTITTKPAIDGQLTTVSYDITLNQPGDKYSFTVDVTNAGTIDAKLYSFDFAGVDASQDVYVNYGVTGMNVNELLTAGDTKTITVSVEYDPSVTSAQLPTTDQSLSLTATLNFVQNQ